MTSSMKMRLGGVGLLIIVSVCVMGLRLFNLDAHTLSLEQSLHPISFEHPLGTDVLGRSQLARVLEGGKTTLGLTLIAVVLSSGLGVILGLCSGYCEGWVDAVIGWIMDTLLAFPNMILALGIVGMLGPSLTHILISVVFVSWISYAKLTRRLTHALKQKTYVKIALLSGANHQDILIRHILKQLIPYVVILMAMDIGVMMLRIAGLSFLGLGANTLQPEWGMMIQESRRYITTAPWLLAGLSGVIFITVLLANVFAQGLTETLDPKRSEL